MGKLIVGICDDEKVICGQLEKMIGEILNKEERDYEVRSYFSGEELLEEREALDVLFLDLNLSGTDGIQIGKRLRFMYPDCKIIVTTACVDRFKEAFRVQAFRFVTKPIDKEEVKEALTDFLRSKIETQPVQLYYNRKLYLIPQKEIRYIKAVNGVECRVKDKFLRSNVSMSNMMKKLDDRMFVRISHDYSVNLRYVESYQKGIIFSGGLELAVSRRRKKAFELKWMEFDLYYR